MKAASKHDFESFAAMELQAREELNFPPFSRLILIELLSDNLSTLKTLSENVARYLSSHLPETAEVLGPVDAPIPRKKGKYRMHILIKSRNPRHLKIFIQDVIDTYSKGKETVIVDVDPLDLI